MVEVTQPEVKKEKGKVKGPSFEVQEYKFSEMPETSSDKFKFRTDLYDKYKDDRNISLKESTKLYSEVRKT